MFEKITPEEAGIPSSEIRRYINYLNDNSYSTHALLLLRDGKIFTEAYWKPFDKDFCHRQYSQTKSYVGIAIGLLIEEGKLSLDDRIIDYFPEKIDDFTKVPDRLKRQTIRNMLTMTTVGEDRWWFGKTDPDRTHIYFNDREKAKLPGALWEYDSPGSQVLSSLVEKLTGMPLFDFLSKKLFSHMGTFKTARILKTPNGDSWGDSALLCTPRDMASFAQLLMDNGSWQGKQLISADYVKEATSSIVDNSEEKAGHVFSYGYGYQIWRHGRDGFAFVGMGGQLTLVVPSKRLIFIINSDTQGNPSAYDIIVNGFFSFIVDRISDAPLPDSPDEYKELECAIGKLELFSLHGIDNAPIKEKINNVSYVCEENSLGITEFTFSFDGDRGEFRYTNEQGDKILPFGINKNVFGKFPELGYSDEIGREVTTNGHMYSDAVSLRFTEAEKLQIKVQIIDKYFGNFLATFAFVGDEATAKFTATAENFLGKYNGKLDARRK